MSGRQPKLALRICAASCLALWLIGVAACDLEHVLEFCRHSSTGTHEHHDDAVAEHEHAQSENAEDAHGESHASHDAEGHSRGSGHHDGKGDQCCSKLKAIAQAAKPIVFSKPTLPTVSPLCVLLEAYASALHAREPASDRPPHCREWTFTPGVSLGPAHRSHAPPSLS